MKLQDVENVILASGSPRRRELLSKIIENFRIMVSETDENLGEEIPASKGVRILAERKGRAVLDELSEEGQNALIISSDTLVELDEKQLGKPTSEEDARAMLRSLSGKRHNVRTGIAIHYKGRVSSGVATTGVYFKELTESDIDGYIATGEPMDKAGSYGIQGLGGKFVERIEGDFDTVVGFSVGLFAELLSGFGIEI